LASGIGDEKVARLPWHPSLDQALALANQTGKPIFIDFTGYTCVNCRWMEKKVFAKQPVLDTLRDRFVLVQLYTDGGPDGDKNQRLQVERFRTLAMPYYVILAPDNAVLATHAGILPSVPGFLDFLSEGDRAAPALKTAGAPLEPRRG
jgi:thiol:disulfide interchange protein